MRVFPGNASHIGQRAQQQDAYALSDFNDDGFIDHGGYLAVVADGIGGMRHGDVASQIAVSSLLENYQAKSVSKDIDTALDDALVAASQALSEEANRLSCVKNMGSTLVTVVIHDSYLYWRSIGDSHVYLCREGRLSQLNADQNFARTLQQWVLAGLISQNMADYHPDRHALQNYLGMGDLQDIERNSQPLTLQTGDKVLLCSDGIHGVLSHDEMVSCLESNNDAMSMARSLCDRVLAKQHAYQDNLTAVVLMYGDRVMQNPGRKTRQPFRWWRTGQAQNG